MRMDKNEDKITERKAVPDLISRIPDSGESALEPLDGA